ncbi:hypothetical protein D3Z51_00175 [Clostridiaceae bacterium]|nr:hypothetical protein [Clostridiaceae bacterium]RKI16537.1 hypothetical protein D7V81_04735 [bacterium 1XD21-70]
MRRAGAWGVAVLLLSLAACGKKEDSPVSAADFGTSSMYTAVEICREEQESLERLREESSVISAIIVSDYDAVGDGRKYECSIDLEEGTATIRTVGREEETYLLDSEQIDSLSRLLSGYALTVHDGSPYWPRGDYCTMIVCFEFGIWYDGGYYRENGALGWPEGWDEFIEVLDELIISGERLPQQEGSR